MGIGASCGFAERNVDIGENMQNAEERSAYKASMPRVELGMRHLEGCVLLPSRFHLLDLMPRGAIAAEIGVASGDFTAEILRRTKPRKLHLVDLWGSERYAPAFTSVLERFSNVIEDGNVEINRGLSTKVLSSFEDGYFDWVYIDTSHSYDTTRRELLYAASKCKIDGRICGHDFTAGNSITPVPYGVIEACNEFCVQRGWRYEYLTLESHGHFSYCLKKLI